MIRTSEDTEALMQALVAAQAAIGGRVVKDSKAQAGQRRYGWASLPGVLEVVTTVLGEHGLAWIATSADGVVCVRLVHVSGQWVECQTGIRTDGLDPQGVGSALSYGRRYGLMALLGLAADDDDAQRATSQHRAAQQAPPPPQRRPTLHQDVVASVREAIRAALAAGVTEQAVADLLGAHGATRVAELNSPSDARAVLDELIRMTNDTNNSEEP